MVDERVGAVDLKPLTLQTSSQSEAAKPPCSGPAALPASPILPLPSPRRLSFSPFPAVSAFDLHFTPRPSISIPCQPCWFNPPIDRPFFCPSAKQRTLLSIQPKLSSTPRLPRPCFIARPYRDTSNLAISFLSQRHPTLEPSAWSVCDSKMGKS